MEKKMNKLWVKRLTAVSLVLMMGTGAGGAVLQASGEEMSGKTGGGGSICELQGITLETPLNDTEDADRTELEKAKVETKNLSRHNGDEKKSEQTLLKKKLAENQQTLLDVSKGNIRISSGGASGGGLSEKEKALNPKGYWITGTTSSCNIIVDPGVKTDLTLDGVSITCNTATMDCLNVSHADVTITLMGDNLLRSNSGTAADEQSATNGNAVTKNGMDGSLTIQCLNAGDEGHVCSQGTCGSLTAQGNPAQYHAGGIGNAFRNFAKDGEAGFCNLTIRGGIVNALAGKHSPGIGSSCRSEDKGGYTKNIRISGGIVTAKGNEYCSGIGSGLGNTVDGVYITGGTVRAEGGTYAPGIGASSNKNNATSGSMATKNVVISGGDTKVTAVGDRETGMPGIGSGGGAPKVSHLVISPDKGYQGYIQDGRSETDYTFADGTPFTSDHDIVVANFFTMLYFGPYRDVNEIDKDSREQIGANHVISKSGGKGFTEEQMKELTKVTAKDKDGASISGELLVLDDKSQLDAVNQAKTAWEIGDFPLTYRTQNGTKATVIIYLRNDGTDAGNITLGSEDPMVGANDFEKETGGGEFTEDELKEYAQLKGKDKEGNVIDLKDFQISKEQMKVINEAKTAGKSGVFDLTYKTEDGTEVSVQVTLKGEFDEITENPGSNELIKGKNIISRTGGTGFTDQQLKDLSMVRAVDKDGNQIPQDDLTLPDKRQIEAVNRAKEAGGTGDFPLTFQTPDGTQVTVTVFLREEGNDSAGYVSDHLVSFIGADNVSLPTGGKELSAEETITLCRAKGKDKNGDNAVLSVRKVQLDHINRMKKAEHTGIFDLTFLMEDGTEVTVKVTLTGNHKVEFDTDGGKETPREQTVQGGDTAVKPGDPIKEGWIFKGWYYVDEDGKEEVWDFDTPVHKNMVLKAKWEKTANAAENSAEEKKPEGTTASGQKKRTQKEKKTSWKYREVRRSLAKTGERSKWPWILTGTGALLGIGFHLLKRQKSSGDTV